MPYLLSVLLGLLLVQCYSHTPVENSTSDVADPVGTVTDCVEVDEDEGTPMDTIPKLIQVMVANTGVPPTDSVNAWLAFVGLPPNNPWCAAAQSVWLHQAGVKEPLLKTGLARNYMYQTPERLHITAGRVLAGVVDVPAGSLVVYGRGETIFGHIGANTERWSGQRGIYVSGNTSPPGGATATGGGVWVKDARINPNAHLRITHFILVNY